MNVYFLSLKTLQDLPISNQLIAKYEVQKNDYALIAELNCLEEILLQILGELSNPLTR